MKPKWKLKMSYRGTESFRTWRDDDLGVQKEEHTTISGKVSTYYYSDYDHHQYRSEAAMLAALQGSKQ
jgi:hypothetical protein